MNIFLKCSSYRPLIDYESMLMMEPMTLAGTIIGVNLNTVRDQFKATWVYDILIKIGGRLMIDISRMAHHIVIDCTAHKDNTTDCEKRKKDIQKRG